MANPPYRRRSTFVVEAVHGDQHVGLPGEFRPRRHARRRNFSALTLLSALHTQLPCRFRHWRSRYDLGVAALVVACATLVSTSVPANAYFVDTPERAAVKLAAAAQPDGPGGGWPRDFASGQEIAAGGAPLQEHVGRDGYSIESRFDKGAGATPGFTNDTSAAVQWPFARGVPISSGFGSRQVANCSFCSTDHQGLDFDPGAGTPVQSIAAGVVTKVKLGNGPLGNNVWIEHTVRNQKITTVSAHLQNGSVRVAPGQTVATGEVIGQVGNTGNSTGPHLHFEVHRGTTPIDPYRWLLANAGGR